MSIRTTIVAPDKGDWGVYLIENQAPNKTEWAKWTYAIYGHQNGCTAMKNIVLRTYHEEDTVSKLPKWLVVA